MAQGSHVWTVMLILAEAIRVEGYLVHKISVYLAKLIDGWKSEKSYKTDCCWHWKESVIIYVSPNGTWYCALRNPSIQILIAFEVGLAKKLKISHW